MGQTSERMRDALSEVVEQGKLAGRLHNSLLLDDERLGLVLPALEALAEYVQLQDITGSVKLERTKGVVSYFARMINLVASGAMNHQALGAMVDNYCHLMSAAYDFPHPFKQSPAVVGAAALVARARRLRLHHDLRMMQYHWQARLGKPTYMGEQLLKDYPGLMPVIFNRVVDLTRMNLFQHWFGYQPALRTIPKTKAKLKGEMTLALKRWPLTDFYALCPLPTHICDDRNNDLRMADRTWSEQQGELQRLRRQHQAFEVRFARLPELMYLDFAMRLATGYSPMRCGHFRCEHLRADKCFAYGEVDQNGAEIAVEKAAQTDWIVSHRDVLPLFILPTEKAEKPAEEVGPEEEKPPAEELQPSFIEEPLWEPPWKEE